MTNSLSCEREDNVIINKCPQKLNVNVLSWTLQNMCSHALGNIYKHHFSKQKATFDTLHLQLSGNFKTDSLIPSCLPQRARKIVYTKLQWCITKPDKYFQTN